MSPKAKERAVGQSAPFNHGGCHSCVASTIRGSGGPSSGRRECRHPTYRHAFALLWGRARRPWLSADSALQYRSDDIEKSVDHAHATSLLETGDVRMGPHIGAGDREGREIRVADELEFRDRRDAQASDHRL